MSNLFLLIGTIWGIILTISFFLVIFVAPIEIVIFNTRMDLYITSIVQAITAIVIVLILIIVLNYLKREYLKKKQNI
ncbi:MAG: hypothetical protein MRJ93_08755 [Nitrososphaeraceae archaeon]|nr:hypothetical protein [Nitrososphaeraceae archaeon]